MARKPFNWALLDRENLYTMLYELKPYIVGKRLAIKTLQKLLSDHIKWHLPIKVTLKRDISHENGIVYIGGAYYSSYDIDDRRHVEIVFSYKDTDSKIKLSETRWDRMCRLFADTMLQEIIHIRQYRTRSFNWNHKHPVIRAMKKKIIRNLPYAQIGKPFKTPDHLTY